MANELLLTCGGCSVASEPGVTSCPACGKSLRPGAAGALAAAAAAGGIAAFCIYGRAFASPDTASLRAGFFALTGLLSLPAALAVFRGRRAGWIGLHLVWAAQLLVPLGVAVLRRSGVVASLVGYGAEPAAVKLPLAVGLALAWLPAVRAWCSAPSALAAIVRRELGAFLLSPLASVIVTLYLLMFWLNFSGFLVVHQAEPPASTCDFALSDGLNQVVVSVFAFLVFCAPLLTMRLLAEERQSGTFETLATAPVADVDVVLGKFLASLAYFGLLLAASFAYIAMIGSAVTGPLDWGLIASGYLGLALKAAAYVSLGLFVSSLTRHQIVAAAVTFVCYLGLWMAPRAVPAEAAWARAALDYANLEHYFVAFVRGLVDSRAVAFDLSLTALFLFASLRVLEGRRWAAWANPAAMIVGFAGILVFANIYSARHWVRFDLTAAREYRLLDRTRDLLAGLTGPVRIHPFFVAPPEDVLDEEGRHRLRQLLEEFRRASPLVEAEELWTGMDRRRLETIVRELKLETRLTHGTVIVHAGGRNRLVPVASMFEIDKAGPAPRIRSFHGEGLIVAALQDVTGAEAPAIHFARGHGGEGRTERAGPHDATALTYIAASLQARENFEHRPVNLVSAPLLPPDCKVLVIHRPDLPYRDAELAALRDFLRRGGRLCVLPGTIDWRELTFAETGLEGLLREWGVELRRAVVYANVHDQFGRRDVVRALRFGDTDFSDHPIVLPLKQAGRPVSMDLCRPLAKAEGADPALDVVPLITIPVGAWGETSLEQIRRDRPAAEPGDVVGEISVAFAVRKPVGADVTDALSPETRLVVFGNAEFITDAQAQRDDNEALFTNALQWLINRPRSLGVGRLLPDRRVSLDEVRQRRLRWMGLGLPVLAFVAGLGVWWVRRK